MNVSRYRQQLRELFNKEKMLLDTILRVRGIVRGGVYKSKRRCGKEGCKCERKGLLHEGWNFYWSEGGKTKIRSINEADVMSYGKYIREYQKYRQARAELVKRHKEQLKIIDIMEEGLRISMTEKRLKKVR